MATDTVTDNSPDQEVKPKNKKTGKAYKAKHLSPRDRDSFSQQLYDMRAYFNSRINRKSTVALYAVIAFVSLIVRLLWISRSDDGTPIFDEKHYAPQGMQAYLNYGSGMENNPSYGLVVHPFLGKIILGISQAIFGYTPLGWRAPSIIAGVLVVLGTVFLAHLFTKSTRFAVIAAILINVEGVSLTTSRVALLDIFVSLGVLAAVICVVLDLVLLPANQPLYCRWGLLAAGLISGATMAIKISGVYVPAVLGVLFVVLTAVFSKSVRSTLKALGSGLIYFLVLPLTVFMLSWLPWFSSESSVYRHASEAGNLEHPAPEWLSSILGDTLESFYSYQVGVLEFHSGLETIPGVTDGADMHPYESKPWQWLWGARPVSMMTQHDGDMVQSLRIFGNPLMWVLTIVVVIAAIFFTIRKRFNCSVVLFGFVVSLLPWFILWKRQQYFFYTTVWSPFLVLGITLLLFSIYLHFVQSGVNKNIVLWIFCYNVVICCVVVFAIYSPWVYGWYISEYYNESLEFWPCYSEMKEAVD